MNQSNKGFAVSFCFSGINHFSYEIFKVFVSEPYTLKFTFLSLTFIFDKVIAVQINCQKKNGKSGVSSSIHHWQMAEKFAQVGPHLIILVSAQRHPPWNICVSLATQRLEEG